MEWGGMPVSIGLAGAYAALRVGLAHYRTRQAVTSSRHLARPLPAADAVAPTHAADLAPSVDAPLDKTA